MLLMSPTPLPTAASLNACLHLSVYRRYLYDMTSKWLQGGSAYPISNVYVWNAGETLKAAPPSCPAWSLMHGLPEDWWMSACWRSPVPV